MEVFDIRQGEQGELVEQLQEALNNAGYNLDQVDGIFGPETESALQDFQHSADLEPTGIVDAETWERLQSHAIEEGDTKEAPPRQEKIDSDPSESTISNNLSPGSRGNDVQELQELLHKAGFDTGPIDGIFGPQLSAALADFQTTVGLPTEAVFGPDTAQQLELYLALRDSSMPLPEPISEDGRPILHDMINLIGTLDDPLERVRRLMEAWDAARRLGDSEAEAESLRHAVSDAKAVLSSEDRERARQSESLLLLISTLESSEDPRADELRNLLQDENDVKEAKEAKEAETPLHTAQATPKITTDIWNSDDQLGYASYARALAALITHKETVPPLTIGIKAPWGAGKTSLMRMVQAYLDGDLEHTGMSSAVQSNEDAQDAGSIAVDGDWKTQLRFKELFTTLEEPSEPTSHLLPEKSEPGATFKIEPRVTVWFNAWKYQNSEQLWAGLAHCIVSQVTSRLSGLERERFWLRLHARRVNVDAIRRNFYQFVFQEFFPRGLVWLGLALISLVAGFVLPGNWSILGVTGSVLSVGKVTVDWKKKLNNSMQGPVKGVFRDFLRMPAYEGKQGFLHFVESDLREVLKLVATPVQPLVVFIDDLDRCAPPQVAQIVEAINLFLGGDYPNCVFVLGMEPEMVAASLEVSYKDLANKLKDTSATRNRAPLGWLFMEKIVQLPLTIPPPSPINIDRYLRSLLRGAGDEPEKEESLPEDLLEKVEARIDKADNLNEVESITFKALGGKRSKQEKAAYREASKRVYARKLASSDPIVQRFVYESTSLFRANPRQIKRYINLFRFYATLRYSYKLDGVYHDTKVLMPSDSALAKFVALSINWPQAIGWLWVPSGNSQPSLARLEEKAKQLAENKTEDVSTEKAWADYLGEMGLQQEWVLEREFREFLATGEALSKYQGCRLW